MSKATRIPSDIYILSLQYLRKALSQDKKQFLSQSGEDFGKRQKEKLSYWCHVTEKTDRNRVLLAWTIDVHQKGKLRIFKKSIVMQSWPGHL